MILLLPYLVSSYVILHDGGDTVDVRVGGEYC